MRHRGDRYDSDYRKRRETERSSVLSALCRQKVTVQALTPLDRITPMGKAHQTSHQYRILKTVARYRTETMPFIASLPFAGMISFLRCGFASCRTETTPFL